MGTRQSLLNAKIPIPLLWACCVAWCNQNIDAQDETTQQHDMIWNGATMNMVQTWKEIRCVRKKNAPYMRCQREQKSEILYFDLYKPRWTSSRQAQLASSRISRGSEEPPAERNQNFSESRMHLLRTPHTSTRMWWNSPFLSLHSPVNFQLLNVPQSPWEAHCPCTLRSKVSICKRVPWFWLVCFKKLIALTCFNRTCF